MQMVGGEVRKRSLSQRLQAARRSGWRVDGDTINVDNQRIQLFGIDAPEADQTCGRSPCGKDATDALRGLLDGHVVACDQRAIDRYGRIVAVCYAGDQDINAWMVKNGWVMSYVRYRADYAALEGEARQS
jgi:endonuclease YncB( thermonuclease family)